MEILFVSGLIALLALVGLPANPGCKPEENKAGEFRVWQLR